MEHLDTHEADSIVIYTADNESVEVPVYNGDISLSEDNFLSVLDPGFLADDNMWNAELKAIFATTPSPPPKSQNIPEQNSGSTKKSITSHRLLTSEAIINDKQNQKQHKLKVEEEKRQRKENRELKRKLKAESQKTCTKKTHK